MKYSTITIWSMVIVFLITGIDSYSQTNLLTNPSFETEDPSPPVTAPANVPSAEAHLGRFADDWFDAMMVQDNVSGTILTDWTTLSQTILDNGHFYHTPDWYNTTTFICQEWTESYEPSNPITRTILPPSTGQKFVGMSHCELMFTRITAGALEANQTYTVRMKIRTIVNGALKRNVNVVSTYPWTEDAQVRVLLSQSDIVYAETDVPDLNDCSGYNYDHTTVTPFFQGDPDFCDVTGSVVTSKTVSPTLYPEGQWHDLEMHFTTGSNGNLIQAVGIELKDLGSCIQEFDNSYILIDNVVLFKKCCPINEAYQNDVNLPDFTSVIDDITAGNNVIQGQTQGAVVVESSDIVRFQAGADIVLKDGFRVDAGGFFNAKIAECNLYSEPVFNGTSHGSNPPFSYQPDDVSINNGILSFLGTGAVPYNSNAYILKIFDALGGSGGSGTEIYNSGKVYGPFTSGDISWNGRDANGNVFGTVGATFSYELTLFGCITKDFDGIIFYDPTDAMKRGPEELLTGTTGSEPFFSLYPNPNNGQFNVEIQLGDAPKALLEIYDPIGRKVITEVYNADGTYPLAVNNIGGLYIARIIIGEKEFSKKLVVHE